MIKTYILKPDLAKTIKAVLSDPKADGYAKAYAQAVPESIEYGEQMIENPVHSLQVQLRYIVSNLSRWRGDAAKASRAVLKAYFDKEPFIPCDQPELN